jgi:hypothetical protein
MGMGRKHTGSRSASASATGLVALRPLALTTKDVFGANAILRRSEDARGISASLWPSGWKVHLWFLSVVQPNLIICLGNDQK